ncbi:hypothetical protein OQA88_6844 [Cercophora sp. LCS_1]
MPRPGNRNGKNKEKPIPAPRGRPTTADDLASFVETIKSLNPPEAGDLQRELSERPAKRARMSHGPGQHEPIRIGTARLVFPPREIGAIDTQEAVICREDVGKQLELGLIANEHEWEISFSPRGNRDFWVSYAIRSEELSDRQLSALVIAERFAINSSQPGRIWASLNIRIELNEALLKVEIEANVFWNESANLGKLGPKRSIKSPQERVQDAFFSTWFCGIGGFNAPSPSPQDFYEATFVPDKDMFDQEVSSLTVPGLQAALYPFQRRAVQWLLRREGVHWCAAANGAPPAVQPYDRPISEAPIPFLEAQDDRGESFYFSPTFEAVTRDTSLFRRGAPGLLGGILADEMGLGKTLEVIALIMLHQNPSNEATIFDPFSNRNLLSTSATLIVSPSSLLEQWLSELSRHAPGLKVLYYPGFRKATKEKEVEMSAEYLARHDVVITTYEVLRNEIWIATDAPERAMRNSRRYERPTSPLVQLCWWRVCIDEAQMVENWMTAAAQLARRIPRINAWAITGTPVKDDIAKDLRGLLNFLRYEPYASDTRVWNMFTTKDIASFRKLIHLISMRHTKSLVRNEISIPPQRRYVITMPFTAIEEQHYQSLFQELAGTCGLDVQGNPVEGDWNPDDPAVQSAMRSALDRLRQTALHPEVGNRNRRALGHKVAPMRTVSEVLDAMLEMSESAKRADQRNLLSLKITKGQILAGLKQVKEALAIWEAVRDKSTAIVKECRAQLEKEIQEARKNRRDKIQAAPGEDEIDDESEAREGSLSPQVGEARRRFRSALEIQHRAVFFCANGYFSIKTNEEMTVPGSEEFQRLEKMEMEGYDLAKAIRKEILHESYSKAKALMDRLAKSAQDQSFAVVPESQDVKVKGLESAKVVDALRRLAGLLDAQANQLDEWREHVIQLLLEPLVDEEDDVTGEEYDKSTKLQDEILLYLQVLKAVIADRITAVTGQKNFLAEHEAKVAIRLAKEGGGPFPGKLLEMMGVREEIRPEFAENDPFTSLGGIVSELRALSVKMRHEAATGSSRASTELTIVTSLIKVVQSQRADQLKSGVALDQEVERFTDTLNARLDFYRQLQGVSDMVRDFEGDINERVLELAIKEEQTLQTRLATAESKHRYLVHLKETESSTEEQKMCVICQSTFSIGVLTVCGHQFCKECITLWFRAHRNCPVCKRHLTQANLHDITLKPQELRIHSEGTQDARETQAQSQMTPSKKVSTIYSEFNPEKLAEIKNIDLNGPNYTTKVDTLVRHILWLRESDPGAKSIVFSQYKEFLDVLTLAFRMYRIGWTSFDKAHGTTAFKEDAGTEVFLLHARAHASGLNLVNASHVFLCEPLLNTALELQAIARVHRIGQQQETTVWLYIVDGTVEESIYNLSVQRRMEHMGRSLKGKSKESTPELLDASLDAANTLEMQQAHLSKLMGKNGISGEAVDKKDLWACLFGHVNGRRSGDEQRLLRNPVTRAFLAAEAADQRRREGEDGQSEG